MLVAHDTKVSPFMSESVHDPLTIFRYSEVSCNSVRLKKADKAVLQMTSTIQDDLIILLTK